MSFFASDPDDPGDTPPVPGSAPTTTGSSPDGVAAPRSPAGDPAVDPDTDGVAAEPPASDTPPPPWRPAWAEPVAPLLEAPAEPGPPEPAPVAEAPPEPEPAAEPAPAPVEEAPAPAWRPPAPAPLASEVPPPPLAPSVATAPYTPEPGPVVPATATAAPTAPAPVLRESHKSSVRNFVEWVLIVAGALVVALVIKATLVQAFYIPSESMVPTLQVGDRVLVNKMSYRLHPIHRGDVVVFSRPPDEADPRIKDLIKRVIGLPGETIEARDGRVFIDGRALDEPYLPAGTVTANLPRQQVPPDHYFVMGDNRANSRDSRVFHTIAKNLVVGRAFVRVWPIRDIGLI